MRQVTRRGLAVAAAFALAVASAGLAAAESPSPGTGPAVDDAYSVAEDTILTIAAPGLLANDLAPPTSCVALLDASGLAGAASVNADGSFTFTPAANATGETAFTYGLQLVGADGCPGPYDDQATVRITVTPVNDPPTALADSFQALRGSTLNVGAPGVLGNDSDVDGDPLTASKVSNPIHGVVVLAADGSFSYTPSSGFTGSDAFSYRASDGAASSATRVVTIQVTAVPEPTPTPIPTPTPSPSPTPEVTASPEPSPTDTPEPAATDDVLPTFAVVTAAPSRTPSASLAADPAAREGGLSTPVFLVLVLVGVLAVIGGAFGVSRWLDGRRQGGGAEPG